MTSKQLDKFVTRILYFTAALGGLAWFASVMVPHGQARVAMHREGRP